MHLKFYTRRVPDQSVTVYILHFMPKKAGRFRIEPKEGRLKMSLFLP